jgi:DNA-binding NtrC family response regulator
VKTILVVDDDENARVLCERQLRFGGYRTKTVASGEEALRYVDQDPDIGLIVLDVKMEPVDGVQVLEELRAKKLDIPVILYSDYPSYKRDFKTWLADAFLVKSSDLTELKKTAKELLASPRRRRY